MLRILFRDFPLSPCASHRRHQYAILASSSGNFYRRLFSYISTKRQQNVSLHNRQMSLKSQKCRGNLPGSRQNGEFSDMRIERKGQVFTRVGLVDLYSVLKLRQTTFKRQNNVACI